MPSRLKSNRLHASNLRLMVSDSLQELLVGAMIPVGRINESQLAKRLHVSRTPLREALVSLEREGFVTSGGRGFTVPPLREREAREIYPMLAALEGLALRSSNNFETGHLKKLRTANKIFQRAAGSPRHAQAADNEFHHLLLANCVNRILLATIARQKLLVRRYEVVYLRQRGSFERSVLQHSQIIDALENDDRDGAAKTLEQNWQCALDMVLTSPDWPD